MESSATAEFHDWELLLLSPKAAEDEESRPLEELGTDSDGGSIQPDYFALDSDQRYPKITAFPADSDKVLPEEELDEAGLVDSYNPSWVDPEPISQYLDRPKEDLGFPGIELPRRELGGFLSDDTSDGQISHRGSEKGELGDGGSSEIGDGFDRVVEEDEKAIDIEGIEIEGEERSERSSVESAKIGENSNGSTVKDVAKNVGVENVFPSGGERRGMTWWKLPLELLKFCAYRVKPVWSISIAAAILGVFILGKKLYRMKHKTRSIPLKISLDEKKATQFKIHAARLNEAFSAVKRVPVTRALQPAGGLTPWPVVGIQ